MNEKKKYLLILSALSRAGGSSDEMSKEIQIECIPDELKFKIEEEKNNWDTTLQRVMQEINLTSDGVLGYVTVSIKQVLPL